MEAERWRQIDALFAEALELPPAARSAHLARAGRDDDELRRAVETLIAADERAGGFLERPALTAAGEGDEPELTAGLSFGPYRLERLLGRGGMGTVYLARRGDGLFERRVAVKLLHRGEYGPEALRRFRAERRTLARLEHPSIARLYDGGESEEGLPFLVMEYVEGLPLDVYCDRHRLTVDERLKLCRRLFDAVAYAHQNLLVHRDIKPGNVLVTSRGELKLLDFGIAELTEDPEGDSRSTVPRAMTPGYASPEQIRGEAITTVSDVYALGVVLYELLCGRSPHRVDAGAAPDELERAILEREPEPPSRTLDRPSDRAGQDRRHRVCLARRAEPGELRRKLSGDLDAIVLRALRKDPRERYPSATAIDTDVHRYLHHRPVSARSATVGYRAGKLIRRHRTGVALLAVAYALVVALGASLHLQGRRAEHERDKARQALEFLVSVFEQADPYQRGAETVSARDVLQAGARRASRELTAQPDVQAALVGAIGKAALGLRQLDDAKPLLERALALRRQISPNSRELAESLDQVAWHRFLASDFDASEALFRESLALRKRLGGPDSPEVAKTLNSLGMVLGERYQGGDPQRSRAIEALHREALRIFAASEVPAGVGVAESLFRLAKLMQDRGDLAAAERLGRENLRISLLRRGENDPETATSLRQLALILSERERIDEAQELLDRALAAQRRSLPADHPDVLLTLNDLALVAHRRGDEAGAEARYREALDGYLAVYGEVHAHTAVVMSNLATTLLVEGRAEEAAALHERALAIKRVVFGERHPFVVEGLNALARAYSALGRHAEALDRAERSLALAREVVGTAHPTYAKSLGALGLALHRAGRSAAAEPYLRQALDLLCKTHPADHFRTARMEVLLGSCLAALGRFREAGPLLARGLETLEHRFAADHPYVREARDEVAAYRRTIRRSDPGAG